MRWKMAPLFKKKGKGEEEKAPQAQPAQPATGQPAVEKPTEGICAKCGSTNLSFFDDGTGRCNNCGRIFNWKKALVPETQESTPPQAQTLFKEAPAQPAAPSPGPPAQAPAQPEQLSTPQPALENTAQSLAEQPRVPSSPPPPPQPVPQQPPQTAEPAGISQPQTVMPPGPQAQPVQQVQPMQISTPEVITAGTFRRSEKIEESIVDLKNKIERVSDTTERYRLEINEIKESIARIESRLHELTALYDAISAQFNPFIDTQIKRENPASEDATVAKQIGEDLTDAMILDKVACPKCGELIPEDSKVCPKCGANLENPEQSLTQEKPSQENIAGTLPQGTAMPQPVMVTFPQMQMPPGTAKFGPLLQSIGNDYRSSLLAMRWIEYLLERVTLEDLPQVLDYYRKINWISNEVKADILWKIKGIKIEKKPQKIEGKEGWRLSINDHLRTLMFIEMLRGTQLDKQTLEDLEKEMEKLKNSLGDFYGI